MLKIKDIDIAINGILAEITEIRHHLHAHPELSLKEYSTSEFVRSQLSELEMQVLPPFLETDVVAILNPGKGKRNLTLRADMDALPITEKSNLPYRSQNKGVMHACGHDGHTAMLLGAARVLNCFREHLGGSLRFVFQPGEEMVAAGKELVESGALKDPEPDIVLALHGWPGFPVGAIAARAGEMMAAADFFKISIKGQGGHGSKISPANNPIVVASRIVDKLSSIPDHDAFLAEKPVVNVSKLWGGTAANVVPSEVEIEGSVRYFENSTGEKVQSLFRDILERECSSSGLSGLSGLNYDLDYSRPYTTTVNDAEVIKQSKKLTRKYMGAATWVDMEEPVMSSEDFSWYIREHPGAMFFLGMGENSPGLHTNFYNFNDQALKNGIRLLVYSTINFLNVNID